MKRFFVLLIIIILLSGCAFVNKTISNYDDDEPEEKETKSTSTSSKTTTISEPEKKIEAKSSSCDDSEDGGNRPDFYGKTIVKYGGEVKTLFEKCEDDYVIEYYCDDNEYKSYKKFCENGCEDGACRIKKESEFHIAPEQSVDRETVLERKEQREDSKTIKTHCINGFRDEDETDIDCGGSCTPCVYGKKCNENADCKSPYFCNVRQKTCLERKY